MKACCFTGHQPQTLPWITEEENPRYIHTMNIISGQIEEAIQMGVRDFYVGMARGFDLMAAKLVLLSRSAHRETKIKLIAVIPYKNQAAGWDEKERADYEDILNRSDEQICLQEQFSRDCYKKRNQYMIGNSDMLIAAFHRMRSGSGQAYRMAKKKEIYIVHFHTETFETICLNKYRYVE